MKADLADSKNWTTNQLTGFCMVKKIAYFTMWRILSWNKSIEAVWQQAKKPLKYVNNISFTLPEARLDGIINYV